MEKPPATPPSHPPTERKAWPMHWVVFAILGYAAIHTVVTLGFRKPGSAHEPAAEARERKSRMIHASMNGWTRFTVALDPLPSWAPPADEAAAISRAPAPERLDQALPFDLVGLFPGAPSLHDGPAELAAPAVVAADVALRVRLRLPTTAAHPAAFGETLAYARDHHLHIFLQDGKRVPLDASPIPFAPVVEVALPPGALAAGAWTGTLYTADTTFTWTFEVR